MWNDHHLIKNTGRVKNIKQVKETEYGLDFRN